MPINTTDFTVGTASATKIVTNANMSQDVLVHNNTADTIIYLGADDQVNSSTGAVVLGEERISLEIRPGDEIYAIGDTTGIDVRVLTVTKR